jgi:UDP-N-acetylglucosamine 2-epimerase (non-hydrolysing)
MIYLINNSEGVISDSGGIQEEVISAKKNILVCRDTTERPETIDSGYGKLVGLEIVKNIDFLRNKNPKIKNPYGENVSIKITDILSDLRV